MDREYITDENDKDIIVENCIEELEDTLMKIKRYLFYSKKIILGIIPTITFSGIVCISLLLHFSLNFKSTIVPLMLSSIITLAGGTYIYKETKKRKQSKINLKLTEDEINRLRETEDTRIVISEKKETNNKLSGKEIMMTEIDKNIGEKYQKKVLKRRILKPIRQKNDN